MLVVDLVVGGMSRVEVAYLSGVLWRCLQALLAGALCAAEDARYRGCCEATVRG